MNAASPLQMTGRPSAYRKQNGADAPTQNAALQKTERNVRTLLRGYRIQGGLFRFRARAVRGRLNHDDSKSDQKNRQGKNYNPFHLQFRHFSKAFVCCAAYPYYTSGYHYCRQQSADHKAFVRIRIILPKSRYQGNINSHQHPENQQFAVQYRAYRSYL